MKRTIYRCFGAQAPLHLLSRSQLNDAIWVLEDGESLWLLLMQHNEQSLLDFPAELALPLPW